MVLSLTTFLDKMYWIDVSIAVMLVGICYLFILLRARGISKKNQAHNIELYSMRAEIYTEYEKNFFL